MHRSSESIAALAGALAKALRELDEKGKNTAMVSICAAGGLGAACILERT